MRKKWANVWSYTQQDYRSSPSTIENQVQIVRIRSNHVTNQLKLRFSNEYGMETIKFHKVLVRVLEEKTLNVREEKVVHVAGKEEISIFPASNLISDTLTFEVKYGMILEIETHLKKPTVLHSGTVSYSRRELEVFNYVGDNRTFVEQKELFQMVKDNTRMFYVYGISGVDFLVNEKVKTIVAFGDSLTQQGFWVDHLKGRLFQEKQHEIAILNRGIGGSRMLKGQNPKNDVFTRHGNAGLFRFEKELFMYGEIDSAICFHGINDLISRHDGGNEYEFSFEDILLGFTQYANLAHQHNVKAYIATITPMKHSIFFNESFEKERQAVNEWIREQRYFDGVFDFEKAVVDKNDSALLAYDYDCGDGLHLSDKGGKALAESIDLAMLLGNER
ncbi:Lysophospholipase L1 [Pilibacter termitis]|uniref:Lysophospholipase L1 n=1 Tax=Pilibacter termitis TaxID=263852 RepID=A0A1T4R2S8_9ENTE|nr:GDSL-type esterase/lipase family protein [Pilibacter termitis]SKA10051.1 Lysophospholipase L1 [Pilibacter termitis]